MSPSQRFHYRQQRGCGNLTWYLLWTPFRYCATRSKSNQMKQSSKRLYSMLLALGFLLAALFIFFDLIQPTYSELQEKKGVQLSSEKLLGEEQRVVDQA